MVNLVKYSKLVKTPAYYKQFYAKFYENEKICHFLDNDKVLYVLSQGLYPKLVQDVVKEISTNSNVLQMGCTFGSQIEAVSDKIGPYGEYTVIDISDKQLARCQSKVVYNKVNFEYYDARRSLNQKFDTVICFLLLHEMPAVSRTKLINNALESIEEGGKVIFIDYNKPKKTNPFWWFIRAFNRIFQPFAEDLWKFNIQKHALNAQKFSWRKKIYRSGLYQKVVAKKLSKTQKNINNPNFY